MKKYILFMGINMYPKGGWKDFALDSNDAHALVSLGEGSIDTGNADWYEVIEKETGKLLATSR